MDDDRSGLGAPPNHRPAEWRLHAVTEDDLDEIAYLQACADAEQCALALIENARHEANEQGQLARHHAQLAMEHTARQLELLQLASRAEQTIRRSTHIFLPRDYPPPSG